MRAEFARFLLLASGTLASGTLDSIPATDSTLEAGPDLNSIYIDLELFTEESEIQYITD